MTSLTRSTSTLFSIDTRHSLPAEVSLLISFSASHTFKLAGFASILRHLRHHLPTIPRALESVHQATSAWKARGSAGVGRQGIPMSSSPASKLVFSDISSSSTKPPQNDARDQRIQSPTPKMERGGDHSVSHSHRLSFKSYPKDCPPLSVHWYHAVDVGCDQVTDVKLD